MMKKFDFMGDFLVDKWAATIKEINAIGNVFATGQALIEKAAVSVAAGVEIVSDPFNRKTSNKQKQQNYRR